ncbi:MAG: primosomal protein N' [Clostridia bacterium]|nr:primosomal protein N' [Clostridia bacterium]
MTPSDSVRGFVSVRLLDLPYQLDREYQYILPKALRKSVRPGTLLVVPFGRSNKQMTAVAVGFSDSSDFPRLKTVERVLDYPFAVPEEFVPLCMFMKERFFCSFGQAFRTVLPPGINVETETYYTLSPSESAKEDENGNPVKDPHLAKDAETLLRILRKETEIKEKKITELFGENALPLIGSMTRAGLLEKRTRVPQVINEKTVTVLSLAVSPEEVEALLEDNSPSGLTAKQKTLLELLTHYPFATLREVASVGGVGPAVVSTMIRNGLVSKTVRRMDRTFGQESEQEQGKNGRTDASGPPPLTKEQSDAVETLGELLDSGEPSAALLFGVTGSGKTRVIIETVRKVLAEGKTAIVLLPEIGLTAQALSVYRSAFGKQLAVIHSMLSIGERLDAFRAMREGTVRVALGTRSAVFSPLDNLGLIVLDEEQESTYKSENAPRFHARDIARYRCAKSSALLLLSSATPSVESFYKALTGTYRLIRLTRRAGASRLPDVVIEDVRNDGETFPDRLIGSRMKSELDRVLGDHRQSILFVSRRGYQSHVSCRSCGHPFQCPHCSVSLTMHAYDGRRRSASGRLICHYCGYTTALPTACPSCGSPHVGCFGFGTQKLQDELEERFPDARVARMDTDTTGTRDSHEQILSAFGRGETDILCGTQMVTKGLDFPSVDLVGVVSADSLLYQSDFRAGEKAFSLITQLVGRAGRAGQNGVAILQTFNPGNEILRLAAKQDYEAFYASECRLRKAVKFPPFCSLFALTVSSRDEAACEKWAEYVSEQFADLVKEADPKPSIRKFGPYPSTIYKEGNRYRRCVLFKYSDTAAERAFFASLLCVLLDGCPRDVRIDADANPLYV